MKTVNLLVNFSFNVDNSATKENIEEMFIDLAIGTVSVKRFAADGEMITVTTEGIDYETIDAEDLT